MPNSRTLSAETAFTTQHQLSITPQPWTCREGRPDPQGLHAQGPRRSAPRQLISVPVPVPDNSTGISPAELLLNRRPRSKLELALPDLTKKVRNKQQKQKIAHDQYATPRQFAVGDQVYVWDLPSKKYWIPGTIVSTAVPLSFNVSLSTGHTVRRHSDHLCLRSIVE